MKKINTLIQKLDSFPLWFLGIILEIIVFVPYFIMGEKSVFVWHDQMDENILHYIFTARHLGDGLSIFPEMMKGLSSNSFQPNAYLFVPLYRLFSPFIAFVISYAIIFALAFFGMYFCVREFTESSITSLICAGCFAMLPFYPVYGGAVAGVPLCIYSITCLSKKKNIILSYIYLLLFTLTSHLVLSGYAVLGLWAVYLLVRIIKKASNPYEIYGFAGMIIAYIILNINLFKETITGSIGGPSHREEFVNVAEPFLSNVWSVFIGSAMHADSFHHYLILPILVMLLGASSLYKKLSKRNQLLLKWGWITFTTIVLICLLFGFCNCSFIVNWKNSLSGILRNFELDRFYWLLPALWYILLGLCFGIWWSGDGKLLIRLFLIVIMMLPTIAEIKDNSAFYMSVNQMNNGSGITGYISWESYYSKDVMSEIEEAIGKDMSTYRIGHIGMTTAPALMHGFYTVDGYTTNYPLSYKREFREIISDELNQCPAAKDYFDNWGSRCYLYNSQTGISFMNGRGADVKYSDLKYDWDKLTDLGCDYIFSCGEILDATDYNLNFIGEFTSENSYWDIWVYKLGGTE